MGKFAQQTWVVIVVLLLLSSCGGGNDSQSTLQHAGPEPQLQAHDNEAGGMPQLPQAFEGENSPVRESSDDSLLVSGDSLVYENAERGGLATEPGNFSLIPGWHQESAYALYSFEGNLLERPVLLEVEAGIAALPNGDEFPLEYYAAVSDYSRGGWKLYGPFTDDSSIVLNSETERQRMVDSDYRTHVAIMVAGTSRPEGMAAVDIESLQLHRRSLGSSEQFATRPALPSFGVSVAGMAGKVVIPGIPGGEEDSAAKHLYIIARPLLSSAEPLLIKDALIPPPYGPQHEVVLPYPGFAPHTVFRFEITTSNNFGKSAVLSSPPLVQLPLSIEVPANFVATYQRYAKRIELSWDSVPGASGYLLYRDDVNSPIAELGEITSYMDAFAEYGVDHSYWIRAKTTEAVSAYSAAALGRMELLPAHSLRASRGHFEELIELVWQHPALEDGQDVNFDIYRCRAGWVNFEKIAVVVNDNSYSDFDLENYDRFDYYVIARQGGVKAQASNEVQGLAWEVEEPFGVRILEHEGQAPADNLVFTGTAASPEWELTVVVEIDEASIGNTLSFDLRADEPVGPSNYDGDVYVNGVFEPGIHEITFSFSDGDISGGFTSPSLNILAVSSSNSQWTKYAGAFFPLLLEIPADAE